eukprot:GILJ01011537.1.p1 GENE.GILJ01011537.1~~GILJ01011537.1.p1  ORF type:complete len:293 (-),score=25.51 GILJ01011537.1:115-993(-)
MASPKVALITGSGRGVGAEIALEFARKGFHTVLCGRNQQTLDQMKAKIIALTAGRASVSVYTCDVGDWSSVDSMVKDVIASLKYVDVLVNNAAIESSVPFHLLDPRDINQIVSTNQVGAMYVTRALLPHMLKRKRGSIIMISSMSAKWEYAHNDVYASTKAGLLQLVRCLRSSYRNSGVKFSAIIPGFIRDAGFYERLKQDVGKKIPSELGTVPVGAVVKTVLRAAEEGYPEYDVMNLPMKPIFAFNQLSPTLGEKLFAAMSYRVVRWFDDVAHVRAHAQTTQVANSLTSKL